MASQPTFASIYIITCQVIRCDGERPSAVYIAALDFHSSKYIHAGIPTLSSQQDPPYPTDPQALLVTVQAEELACLHLALGWRIPKRVLDLSVEFRNMVNGGSVPGGPGLVGALIWYGLPASGAIAAEVATCQVRGRLQLLARLFRRMRTDLDWGRALLRGRYLMSVAKIETTGVPVDATALMLLADRWPELRLQLVAVVDASFGCYRGGRFDIYAFEDWLTRQGISWPRNALNRLDLGDAVFKDQTRAHPSLRPLKELRATLGALQPAQVSIGRDGRNRTPLRPFASRTGRNQPSTMASILGGPAWTRSLIRPEPGKGMALIDWCQQEFGIAAALSCDAAMQKAYRAGDPYLAFAIAAGAAPEHATAQTHPDARGRFKACALGVQYGMGAITLGRMLNMSKVRAMELLAWHKRIFPKFWRWSDDIEAEGLLLGRLQSVFGWQVDVGADANPRFLRNFPMQANGAEMLRLACCLMTEAGIRVCAPLHDALLVEARISDLEATVAETQRLMAQASRIVLDGFELRSEVHAVRYPDRLGDDRGIATWSIVKKLIEEDGA